MPAVVAEVEGLRLPVHLAAEGRRQTRRPVCDRQPGRDGRALRKHAVVVDLCLTKEKQRCVRASLPLRWGALSRKGHRWVAGNKGFIYEIHAPDYRQRSIHPQRELAMEANLQGSQRTATALTGNHSLGALASEMFFTGTPPPLSWRTFLGNGHPEQREECRGRNKKTRGGRGARVRRLPDHRRRP
jgi:hypothetical protein